MARIRLAPVAVLASGLLAAASIGSVATAQDKNITFWSTETQPERLQITQGIVERFEEATGIGVTLVPVDEDNLTEIMTSAAATNSPAMSFPNTLRAPAFLTG